MQAFIVEATNHPGELARVADTIAARGVNIEAFCLTYGNKGAAAFLSYDEKGVRTALNADGFTFRELHRSPLEPITRRPSRSGLTRLTKRAGLFPII